jgi:hypothetical protein
MTDKISTYACEVVADIQHFLVTLSVIENILTPFPLKVVKYVLIGNAILRVLLQTCMQETSTDCGIHVLHNMALFMEVFPFDAVPMVMSNTLF